MATIARRRPEAVRELERLQQHERRAAGEPEMSPADFRRLLLDDIKNQIISEQLDAGGLDAAIEAAGSLDEKAERIAVRMLAEWALDDPEQWSRYETASTRYHIARFCARVEAVFGKHGWTLPEVPVVGTLSTGQVSAATRKTKSGAPLVLVDNGFFKFAGVMSQLAAFSDLDLRGRGNISEASLQLLSDLVATHTVYNTCLYTYPRQMPPQVAAIVNDLQDAVCMFVVGHEYAHISAGDLDFHPLAHGARPGTLQDKELAADRRGFVAALQGTTSREYDEAGVFGPFLYFAGLDLFERAAAVYEDRSPIIETESPDDYPTPIERAEKLLDWIGATPAFADIRHPAQEALRSYERILGMWNVIAPVFGGLRETLAAYDPAARGGPAGLPEAEVFDLVRTLWQHVLARIRAG